VTETLIGVHYEVLARDSATVFPAGATDASSSSSGDAHEKLSEL
jgi:hypothetical protein